MNGGYVYLNGRIIPSGEACVSTGDRGLLYGDGLFETMRVLNGSAVRLEKHTERLVAGAAVLAIDVTEIADQVESIIEELCDANGLSDARVRVTITRGTAPEPGLAIPLQANPTVFATAQPLSAEPAKPVKVIVSSIRRDETSPLSRVKSLNYLPGIMAMAEARRAGADDAILTNTQGMIAEGTTGNLFLVKGSTLVTPSIEQGPLPGTTRAALIELAPSLGLTVEERVVARQELAEADEAFFTSAVQLVRPIVEVDGRAVGSGSLANAIRRALA